MSTCLTISPVTEVHELNVESNNGIKFTINIDYLSVENYESTVTVLDSVTDKKGRWQFEIESNENSASVFHKLCICDFHNYR